MRRYFPNTDAFRSIAASNALRWSPALALSMSACVVEPLEQECPSLETGELVLSELRGEQSDAADTRGQWIEFVSLASDDVDLRGLLFEIFDPGVTDIDARLQRGLVRALQGEAVLTPGELFVFGISVDGSLPTSEYELYSVADLGFGLPSGQGRVRLLSCEREIDSFTFPMLPGAGTYAFSGDLSLSAESNDEPANWCTDATPAVPGDPLVGAKGSPGMENPPCP